ncbi:MAG TPA: hypothetical protein VJT72_15685 [Pseudonocardiaceae bacterium]|nr:hypothetical protein [Pseudonocardiaceae bacterium]
MQTDSPDLMTAKRLLDHAKQRGFQFQRVAPGQDGPLVGHRVHGDWVDLIHLEGFSHDCLAWRQRTSPLILPTGTQVQRQIEGSALDVPMGLLVHTYRHGYQYAAPGRGAHAHHRRP